ncbi:HD domain-containing protein [Pseudohalocynthiibacter aestuariivivens]|nr:HD domain-containing protein [Pseudohalocynthiibacter aestuariivivens]QIE44146.1 HD domain-containing protein [Pseudohalocynthiibacter aestuariivivens]
MTSDRFDDALSYASRLHRSQRRKGANIPYISHLLSVCALVIEYGGDEDQAIAGLLHDAVEDQGGMDAARDIEARYGPRVARIVLECSDNESVLNIAVRSSVYRPEPFDRVPFPRQRSCRFGRPPKSIGAKRPSGA